MGRALSILFKRVIPLLLIAVAAGFAVLHIYGDQLLSVQTGSMEPAISTGDLLVVESVPLHELKVGNVITFHSNQEAYAGSTITHRIVELPNETNSRHFITQGDANPTPDEPVAQNRIVGRVKTDIPFVGYALNILSTPIGLLTLIYIPALFIIIDEIRRLARHFEAQKPWRDLSHGRFRSSGLSVFGSIVIVASVLGSSATMASIHNSVIIGSNTITATLNDDNNDCDSDNTIDIDIEGGTSAINIDVGTNQRSTTGDATNTDNTGTDELSSGNASNCNSTSINIDISN